MLVVSQYCVPPLPLPPRGNPITDRWWTVCARESIYGLINGTTSRDFFFLLYYLYLAIWVHWEKYFANSHKIAQRHVVANAATKGFALSCTTVQVNHYRTVLHSGASQLLPRCPIQRYKSIVAALSCTAVQVNRYRAVLHSSASQSFPCCPIQRYKSFVSALSGMTLRQIPRCFGQRQSKLCAVLASTCQPLLWLGHWEQILPTRVANLLDIIKGEWSKLFRLCAQ